MKNLAIFVALAATSILLFATCANPVDTSKGITSPITVVSKAVLATVQLEGESQTWTTSSGDSVSTSSSNIRLKASATADTFSFASTVAAGTYTVSVVYAQRKIYGIYALSINGTQVGSSFDSYSSASSDTWTTVSLGSVTLPSTASTFLFTVAGKNASSSGYDTKIDYILLTPTTTTATATPTASATATATPTATATATPTATTVSGGSATYNLQGFAAAGTTGGGQLAETDSGYAKVATVQQFLDALYSNYKNAAYGSYTKAVKVIEITADLNIGYTEVGSSVTSSTSGAALLTAHATAKLHPVLLTTGVSKIDIKPKTGGLTIFSSNGSTIRHGTLNIKSTSNIIVRNLKFDEIWEWDEATKGNYDSNDWDFIDLGNGGAVDNVWIDHCTFTKAYDGTVDLKKGVSNVTFSWNKYVGDDGATNSNSWVRQQFNALELNKSSYPFYNFLRTNGFSIDDLVIINQGHDKTHLLGSNSQDSGNSSFRVTFNHEWYQNVWDRNPARLRAGNVHVFNNWVDDVQGLTARTLRDTRVAAMTAANQVKLNGSSTTEATYHMGVYLNGSISTEGGALLVENSIYSDCLYPLRNNQTDVTDSSYTGKIAALNTLYHMDALDGQTAADVLGNSTDSGNPLGPFQATIIPFSWNGFTSLPYTYTAEQPSTLKSSLQTGSGAGTLTWSKANWLKTSY